MAQTLVNAMLGYLAAGGLFAVYFVVAGIGRIDPSASKGTWGFRTAVLPGAMLLWPLLAWKTLRGPAPKGAQNTVTSSKPRGGGEA